MDRFHSTTISKESSIVYRKPIFNSARCSATKSSSDCTERRKQQQQQPNKQWCAKSRMRGSETPYPISTKFCGVVGITDIITSANFGEDRLRGLGVAEGQNLPFSIDFDRRPYNTVALLCECVMTCHLVFTLMK